MRAASRRTPVILQAEASECGLACLAMVAGAYGLVTDLAALRRRWSVSLKGTTLAQVAAFAEALQLVPRAVRLDIADLPRLRLPAVLHWDLDHFVVLERLRGRRAEIVDPACGRRTFRVDELSAHFTGIALELTPAPGFERRREAAPLPLRAFFSASRGLAGALVRVLTLSLALQVFVLAAPFFSQLVIDEVIVTGDHDLLTVLGAAFLLLAGIQACITGLRGEVVIALGAALQVGWATRLFRHLVRLPLAWFGKRHVGDVVSRFRSVRAVESLVSGTAVEALVDGLMAVTTITVMALYSVPLAAVATLAVLAYAGLRAALLHPQRRVAHEALALDARENSLFMESVRAILPLKCFAAEASRESAWQGRKVEAVAAEVRSRRLALLQQVGNTAIFAAGNIAVLWLGALAVLAGDLTIGMLVAFTAYQLQFTGRAAALIDHIAEFRLVRVHLDRLADIALAPLDGGSAPPNARPRLTGAIGVQELHFRYADTEPFVLAGLSLAIRAGECVAMTAPSGFGKTTLLKLLLGLLEPTAGMVTVDGVDLRRGILPAYRRQAAAVMQDDTLLAGTLADNIAMFDPAPDERRVQSCARLAAIHDDVIRMPMGYLTLVGDLGSALSGGQRQRLLLARALYARPRVLFLDEATSHLDPATEARIHEALRRMRITRVLIAHRAETLAVADRVIDLAAYSASTTRVCG